MIGWLAYVVFVSIEVQEWAKEIQIDQDGSAEEMIVIDTENDAGDRNENGDIESQNDLKAVKI